MNRCSFPSSEPLCNFLQEYQVRLIVKFGASSLFYLEKYKEHALGKGGEVYLSEDHGISIALFIFWKGERLETTFCWT